MTKTEETRKEMLEAEILEQVNIAEICRNDSFRSVNLISHLNQTIFSSFNFLNFPKDISKARFLLSLCHSRIGLYFDCSWAVSAGIFAIRVMLTLKFKWLLIHTYIHCFMHIIQKSYKYDLNLFVYLFLSLHFLLTSLEQGLTLCYFSNIVTN